MSEHSEQKYDWQQLAIRELLDILYRLAFGGFNSKRELTDRMRLSLEGLEMLGEEDNRGSGRARRLQDEVRNGQPVQFFTREESGKYDH